VIAAPPARARRCPQRLLLQPPPVALQPSRRTKGLEVTRGRREGCVAHACEEAGVGRDQRRRPALCERQTEAVPGRVVELADEGERGELGSGRIGVRVGFVLCAAVGVETPSPRGVEGW
jgi:hypothetical protein